MAISIDQIDLWRQLPSETERVEFKEAKNQFDFDTLCEYCVALGNEGGGHLLLGIRNLIPRAVVGTRAAENPMGMAEKLFVTLGFRVDVEEVAHPHGRVVVFSIPGRPHGTVFHLKGKYLMRSGENLVPMSEDRLRKLFQEGEPDWLNQPAMERVGPTRVLEVLNTTLFFKMLDVQYPSRDAVMERLVEERFAVDEGFGAYTITRLGALLLANELSAFEDLSFKAPRVIVYKGDSKLAQPTGDTPGVMGYVVGFQGLLRHVMNNLPSEEVTVDGIRKDIPLVPEVVIRELLANALVHQDFNIHGSSVMVDLYSNRVEISNPGESIVPVDRLIDGIRSRNERLADFMRRIGICERRGSGIDKVVHAAESLHLPAPYFRVMDQRTLSVAYGPRSFEDMDRSARIRACYQHCALKFENSGRMTNQSLRERFKLPERKSYLVTQVISTAIELGIIRADENAGPSRKFARYVPIWA